MTPRHVPLLVVIWCAALPARAAAQESPAVLVAGFTAEPGVPDGVAEALTAGMADAVRAAGVEVTVVPRGDVLALAGCAEPSDDCLGQALGMLEVQAIVLGEVAPAGDGAVTVELRVIRADGEPASRSVRLGGATADELAADFGPEAGAFWRGEPSPAEPVVAPVEPAPEPVPPGADLSGAADSGGFSAGRVEPWAWAVAGGGVGAMLLGGAFLLAADGKQGDVDSAPTDTAADLEALVELEETGQRYARLGNTLVVVGAVATAVGAVFVVRQGRRGEEAPAVAVAPALGDGSVGLTLTIGGWRR